MVTKRLTAAVALLVAGAQAPAAWAEDNLPYDGAILTACLAAKTGDDRASCIGVASEQCMETPDGQTTFGMVDCLSQESQQWDELLNTTYQAVLVSDEDSDAQMKELGSSVEPIVPMLREMQRAWMAWRDAACEYEAVIWQGGTGGGPASAHCYMELTARQALRLQAYAPQGEP